MITRQSLGTGGAGGVGGGGGGGGGAGGGGGGGGWVWGGLGGLLVGEGEGRRGGVVAFAAAEQAAQGVQPGRQAAVPALIADRGIERAVGLQVVAAARAGRGPRCEVGEGPDHPFRGHVGQAEAAQPRRVDQPATAGQRQ